MRRHFLAITGAVLITLAAIIAMIGGGGVIPGVDSTPTASLSAPAPPSTPSR